MRGFEALLARFALDSGLEYRADFAECGGAESRGEAGRVDSASVSSATPAAALADSGAPMDSSADSASTSHTAPASSAPNSAKALHELRFFVRLNSANIDNKDTIKKIESRIAQDFASDSSASISSISNDSNADDSSNSSDLSNAELGIEQQRVLVFAEIISTSLPLSIYVVFDRMEYIDPAAKPAESARPKRFHRKPLKSLPITMPSIFALNNLIASFLKLKDSDALEIPKMSERLRALESRIRQKALDSLDRRIRAIFTSIDYAPSAQAKLAESTTKTSTKTTQKSSARQTTKAAKATKSATTDTLNHAYIFSALDSMLCALKSHRDITFHTPRGTLTLSLEKTDSIMFFDISALQTFMRVDSAALAVLASFEKPSMRLCAKEVFAKDLMLEREVEAICSLCPDPMLALFGALARASGLEYAFIKQKSLAKTAPAPHVSTLNPLALRYTLSYSLPASQLLVCEKSGIILEERFAKASLFELIKRHYPLDSSARASSVQTPPNADSAAPKANSDKSARDSNISVSKAQTSKAVESKTPESSASESTFIHAQKKLIIYLSTRHDSAIWAYDGTSFFQLLEISFPSDVRTLLATLESNYQDADKLIANFGAAFGKESLDFSAPSTSDTPHTSSAQNPPSAANTPRIPTTPTTPTKNLLDILAPIAKILGYCDKSAPNAAATKAILNSAKLCIRDKGPRIDYKLIKTNEGALALDAPKILRSCMSFHLAGVEREILSYGILDSMAEFFGNFARDMQQNYSMQEAFICGDMLAHKVFLDKIIHYFPKNISLTLPEDGWLDIATKDKNAV